MNQIERLKNLLAYSKQCLSNMFTRVHDGPCTPESSCDSDCQGNYWLSQHMEQVNKELSIKEIQFPRVGIASFILNDKNEILLGKRIGSHGEGHYSVPGGHLEFKESIEKCTLREIEEETGLTDLTFICDLGFCEAIHKGKEGEDRHYITIYNVYRLNSGVPELKEPSKNEGWKWYSLIDLPYPLFGGVEKKSSDLISYIKLTKFLKYFGNMEREVK